MSGGISVKVWHLYFPRLFSFVFFISHKKNRITLLSAQPPLSQRLSCHIMQLALSFCLLFSFIYFILDRKQNKKNIFFSQALQYYVWDLFSPGFFGYLHFLKE